MKRKQGRVTKDHGLCEEEKKGKKKILSRETFVLLDLPLRGDPESDPESAIWTSIRDWSKRLLNHLAVPRSSSGR